MRNLLLCLLLTCSAYANASESNLLVRALTCEVHDEELPSLIHDLAKADASFNKASAMYGAPTANVYELSAPVTALGFSSAEVVVMPTRILLAVPDKSVKAAVSELKLSEAPFSPASREVGPTQSIVAFQLSHELLKGKLLLGCQYASAAAALWP